MNELLSASSIESVYSAVALLAPGVIITYLRSRFLTGRTIRISEATMEYIVVSIVFFAIAIPILPHLPWPIDDRSALLTFILPALLGVVLGVVAQLDLVSKLLRFKPLSWIDLKVAHPMPTSWDYVFANLKTGVWILVTLKSGERVFGYFGGQSFAASDLSKRDLYIEDIRNENWEPIEGDGRTRGIWLPEDEIRLIEIIPAGGSK